MTEQELVSEEKKPISHKNKRFNFTPELKQYIIKSRICEDKRFSLPTPENLSLLVNLNVIKDQIYYDKEKYKTYFKKEEDEEVLDLTNITHILNNKILNSILFFLGAIISKTTYMNLILMKKAERKKKRKFMTQFPMKAYMKIQPIISNIYKII